MRINVLDYYGNIVAVPMSYAKMGTLGNASHATENSIVAKNYISCICQLNENSAAFTENTRIILGNTAYSMRGVNDFTREFTDDQDSVHLLTFTIERSAPLPQDSLELQCADYNSFRWEMNVNAPRRMARGGTGQIQVTSKRMGEVVEATTEHPITYIYQSSNPLAASVNEDGVITVPSVGSAGKAVITVKLFQNQNITESFEIEITNSPQVEFTTAIPETLKAFESITIEARNYNGPSAGIVLTLDASGPPQTAYSITRQSGRNTWVLTCYAASNMPLTLTVSDQYGNSTTAQIILTT